MRNVIEKVIQLNTDLHNIVQTSQTRKGPYDNTECTYVMCNRDNTECTYVMCNCDNRALMTALDFLTERGNEVGSMVFDRLMIYNQAHPK